MSQDTTSPNMNDEKRAALADAAWALLATHNIDQIELEMVSDMAGIDHGLSGAVGGSVQRLLLAKMAALDHQTVLETYGDIQHEDTVSIREKIIEGLLHRFETYAPYRQQIENLNRAARRHPELALRLFDGLEAVVRRILVMSGDPVRGLQGMLRVKGVIGVVLTVARVWMKDDGADLAATMKALDNNMTKAEEWGHSLRLFADDRRGDQAGSATGGDYGHEAGEDYGHDRGRRGVDND